MIGQHMVRATSRCSRLLSCSSGCVQHDVTPVSVVFMDAEGGQTTPCDADGAITRIEFTNRFGEYVALSRSQGRHRCC